MSGTSTKIEKRRFREVYTVTRDLERCTMAEGVRDFLCVQDEVGEYLYGGSAATEEKIEVRLEMWDELGKRWMEVKCKSKTQT